MNTEPFAPFIERHPVLGYFATVFSGVVSAFNWGIQHADAGAKLLAFVAGMFGLMAGYYTFRIQRRAWLEKRAGWHRRRH